MKHIALIAGLLVSQAYASEREHASVASIEMTTSDIPHAGAVRVRGKSDKGRITQLVIVAFGREHILTNEELTPIANHSLNHITITHEAGYEQLGGYSVHIHLARIPRDPEPYTLTVTKNKGFRPIAILGTKKDLATKDKKGSPSQ